MNGNPTAATVDDRFMRDSDAFAWYMERDPILRSTVVSIAWLAARPDWDILMVKADRASRAVPSFRKRIVEPPLRIATPRWVVDGAFDLSYHVRRVQAAPPYDASAVLDVARVAAMTAFDPARPLWEFTLVEGLEHDRAALVMKMHHSLTDGIGGMELALRLFDLEADAGMPDGEVDAPPGEPMGELQLVAGSVTHDVSRLTDLLRHEVDEAWPRLVSGTRHPRSATANVLETARSVIRTVAPVSKTMSPVMTERGLGRRLGFVMVRLDDLKRAAAAAGGTVNDAFVTGVTAGLRRYHEHHGATVEELRMTLPISIRTKDDPVGGNRITLQRFAVPVQPADPAARLPEIGARCRLAAHERSLPLTNAIAGTLNLLPHNVVGGMLKHVDFVASDVPGFPFPVYLAGARLEALIPFGPTIGTAVNATLLSYDGRCGVGITLDTAAVPDDEVFLECMVDGFDEVLALGGDHDAPTRSIGQ